jgi:hypothetical protein
MISPGRDLTAAYRGPSRSRPGEGICPIPGPPVSPSRDHVIRAARPGDANWQPESAGPGQRQKIELTIGSAGQISWIVGKEWSSGIYATLEFGGGQPSEFDLGSFEAENRKLEYNPTGMSLGVNYGLSYSWGEGGFALPLDASFGLPKRGLISPSLNVSGNGRGLSVGLGLGLSTPSNSDFNIGTTISNPRRFSYWNPGRGWFQDTPAPKSARVGKPPSRSGGGDGRPARADMPEFRAPKSGGDQRPTREPPTRPDSSAPKRGPVTKPDTPKYKEQPSIPLRDL